MAGTLSTTVAMVDVRQTSYTLLLPYTTDIPYRVIVVKDIFGAASQASSITVVTQSSEWFEDGTNAKVYTNAFEIAQLYAGQPGVWSVLGGTQMTAATIGFLNSQQIVGGAFIGDGSTRLAHPGGQIHQRFHPGPCLFHQLHLRRTPASCHFCGFTHWHDYLQQSHGIRPSAHRDQSPWRCHQLYL